MSNETPVTLAECIEHWDNEIKSYGSFDDLRQVMVATLSHLRASAAKGDEWQPIETAPKDGTRVILGWPGGGVRYGFYLDNSHTSGPWAGWRGPSMELPFPSPPPTHWQPLPAPPSAAPGEAKCATCDDKGYVYEGECITGRGPDDVHPDQVACPDCAPSPEQQGAEQPIAYLHHIVEPDVGQAGGLDHSLFTRTPENPWSHWMAKHREKCTWTCTPLYSTAPAPALGLSDKEREALREVLEWTECACPHVTSAPCPHCIVRSLLERVKP
jgi:hypothetical protein